MSRKNINQPLSPNSPKPRIVLPKTPTGSGKTTTLGSLLPQSSKNLSQLPQIGSGSTALPQNKHIRAHYKYSDEGEYSVSVPQNTYRNEKGEPPVSISEEITTNIGTYVQILEWWYEELTRVGWIPYFALYDVYREAPSLWVEDDVLCDFIRVGRKEFIADIWSMAREKKLPILRNASMTTHNNKPLLKFNKQNGVMFKGAPASVKLYDFIGNVEFWPSDFEEKGKEVITKFLDSVMSDVITAFNLKDEELFPTLIPEIIDLWTMLADDNFYKWFNLNIVSWVTPTLNTVGEQQICNFILKPDFYPYLLTETHLVALTVRELVLSQRDLGLTPDIIFKMFVLGAQITSYDSAKVFIETANNLPLDWFLEILVNEHNWEAPQ